MKNKKEYKIIIPTVFGTLAVVSIIMMAIPHNKKPLSKVMQNHQTNDFIVDGAPMMPPANFEGFPGHRPMFEPKRPDIEKIIRLSEQQRDDIKKLDEELRHDMKALHDYEEELRSEYLEKMDTLLTAEQFRKIHKMREDLRKDIKKLKDKQFNTLEKHRHEFESILTHEQKRMLEEHVGNRKTQPNEDFVAPNFDKPQNMGPQFDKQDKNQHFERDSNMKKDNKFGADKPDLKHDSEFKHNREHSFQSKHNVRKEQNMESKFRNDKNIKSYEFDKKEPNIKRDIEHQTTNKEIIQIQIDEN